MDFLKHDKRKQLICFTTLNFKMSLSKNKFVGKVKKQVTDCNNILTISMIGRGLVFLI